MKAKVCSPALDVHMLVHRQKWPLDWGTSGVVIPGYPFAAWGLGQRVQLAPVHSARLEGQGDLAGLSCQGLCAAGRPPA